MGIHAALGNSYNEIIQDAKIEQTNWGQTNCTLLTAEVHDIVVTVIE